MLCPFDALYNSDMNKYSIKLNLYVYDYLLPLSSFA